jgi:hypothetical protein
MVTALLLRGAPGVRRGAPIVSLSHRHSNLVIDLLDEDGRLMPAP